MIKTIGESILDFFYPEYCPACSHILQRQESYICAECLFLLPKTHFHDIRGNPVEKVFWGRIAVSAATSCYHFTKKSRIQNILHAIKYKKAKELAEYIGYINGLDFAQTKRFSNIDYIVPVPLHPAKLRKRGFNQSTYFAQGLARALHTELSENNLIRKTNTATQTKKTRYERWKNVGSHFMVKNPELYQNKNILLVDDVITTGATIEACALALSKSKNIQLYIASIAYAL
jgi:competence protein ComFC